MIKLTLDEKQYDELIEALDWAITASDTDMDDKDGEGEFTFENLKSFIQRHKVQY